MTLWALWIVHAVWHNRHTYQQHPDKITHVQSAMSLVISHKSHPLFLQEHGMKVLCAAQHTGNTFYMHWGALIRTNINLFYSEDVLQPIHSNYTEKEEEPPWWALAMFNEATKHLANTRFSWFYHGYTCDIMHVILCTRLPRFTHQGFI